MGEEEGKYMYGDFDWSARENENRAADLYTRRLIAISDNAKKSRQRDQKARISTAIHP